eukprot:TRINITY_DN48455_c0_g1_i2.p3 TRINITY_DN48455_c0_g1~~TRINITY_DN48455_c0_g1_i2.p3  ORF type:complete len:141 (-),score=3.47 TRINITY_DN48455_c0_g1_i2:367-789(-)
MPLPSSPPFSFSTMNSTSTTTRRRRLGLRWLFRIWHGFTSPLKTSCLDCVTQGRIILLGAFPFLPSPRAGKTQLRHTFTNVRGSILDGGEKAAVQKDSDEFLCDQCGKFLNSWQGFRLHQQRKHNRCAPGRSYAPPGHTC